MAKNGKNRLRCILFLLSTVFLLCGILAIPGAALAENYTDPAPFIQPTTSNGRKVLFDNTHGQTAGAADWVIDGAFSDFGNALANQGYYVEELRKGSSITYSDLSDFVLSSRKPISPLRRANRLQFFSLCRMAAAYSSSRITITQTAIKTDGIHPRCSMDTAAAHIATQRWACPRRKPHAMI